jgi:hypothetical protein
MKDVLLLHDNARPHISLRTREAIAKTGRTVVPHPAHSPDLAPSNYHLFSPVRDALRGRHFADYSELKQSPRSSFVSLRFCSSFLSIFFLHFLLYLTLSFFIYFFFFRLFLSLQVI